MHRPRRNLSPLQLVTAMINFVGAARPIIAYDVATAASVYKIDLPGVRAIMDVESKNRGFDLKRRPLILFEPHVLYRELRGEERERAVRLGLAYPRWGQERYPAGQDAQYNRLTKAIAINEEAAFRSISMGMGQVLGENYEIAGCSSAVEMFEQAKESEANQLRHMLNFCKAKGLVPKINAHQWMVVATVYNGKGQAAKYAGWLKAAHDRWQRILSTPREELTVQDLRDAGSKTIASADTARNAIATAAVAGPTAGAALEAAKGMVEPVSQAVQTARQAKDAWEWLTENWEFVAVIGLTALFLVACYFAWRAIKQIEEERVFNARTGVNLRI